jgi:hypothetical protein
MTSRLLARLVTGPAGFFVAGAIDLGAAWGGWALARARERARARLPLKAR